MRVGIVFGCFIPWHIGHTTLLQRALSENDKVVVAVCGYEKDRGKDFILFSKRLELAKRTFSKQPNIVCCAVDDSLCGCDGSFSLENWRNWSALLFKNAGVSPTDYVYTWYTGEEAYAKSLKTLYPNHEIRKLDRAEHPISGTQIRANFRNYKQEIDPVFWDYLNNNKEVEL